jgi:excisionase family DNA binding protein
MNPVARALIQEISQDPEALAELAGLLAPHLPSDDGANEDRWLSTKDAAAYLGLTPNALRKLTASRTVPFEQEVSGGKCWFLRSELDRWRRGQL